MINTVIFNDEIKVWWEYIKLEPKECFKILLDGKEIATTLKSHFNIKNLKADTAYSISVLIVDGNSAVIKKVGDIDVITSMDKRRIDVTKPPYNAIPDGKTLSTLAIQKAVDDCGENDCVYFPDGKYLTGAIDLKSDVELYLSDGAVIRGSANHLDYLPKIKSRFEGCEELCYRSLFNAGKMFSKGDTNCENIVIRGGKVLGGGQELRLNIINAERDGVLKANGLENQINPPYFYSTVLPGRSRGRLLGFNNVKNVVVANCEIGESPSWNLHFTYCENVVTCGCKIVSHKISNGDGWDPDSSKNCIIFDTVFDTGDDCVAIKSGKNLEGYLVGRPSEHIRIFDIKAEDGHGIAIGSEMSGGVSDVVIWNCDISSGSGIYYKSSPVRGGYVRDVKVYNCILPTISVSSRYFCNNDGASAPNYPDVSDLVFENVTLSGVGYFTGEHERVEPETALCIRGLDKTHPIKRVRLKDITLKYRHMLPYQMVCLSDVDDLEVENIMCLGEID